MTIANLIKACSRTIYDRNLILISPQEWLEILNFQAAELYPEIGYRTTISGNISDLGDEYQVDLSGCSNLDEVKEVFLEDSDGNKFPYDNWVYNKEVDILELDPKTSKTPSLSIPDYTKYYVVYFGPLPEFTKTSEIISLQAPKLNIVKNICIKEALTRILYDHAKLDRYRTLVSKMNEYALMAMIDRITTTIELNKRKLVDTHLLKSF